MKILVLNGPNLNMLGKRDHGLYGSKTLGEIEQLITQKAQELGVKVRFFQSNHEGALIDEIQKRHGQFDGILINAGALSHYSYALLDSLIDSGIPFVSVHLSDITHREAFRRRDIFEKYAILVVSGKKEDSYLIGLEKLINHLKKI